MTITACRCPLARMLLLLSFVTTLGLWFDGYPLRAETLRTWRDATGQYRVEASFVAFDDGVVQLCKPGGTEIRVPMEKLSSSDRHFIVRQVRSQQVAARQTQDPPANPALDARPDERPITVRTEKLWGVNWVQPEDAKLASGSRQQTQKPVMWFRVLGDLEGFM
jgi:hypothetical protein